MAKKKAKVEVKETVKNDGVKTDDTKVKAPEVLKFSKKQFVTSQRFAKRKDLVNALLEDGKEYSIKEVEDIIHNFLYGKK